MQIFKRLFDFYIYASFHVAVSVTSLVSITTVMLKQPFDSSICGFAFFGTLFGYNFVKYESFFRKNVLIVKRLHYVLIISIAAFFTSAFFFFSLQINAQIFAIVFFALTVFYAVPVQHFDKNIRNIEGIKIYFVAFCWSCITVLMPIVDYHIVSYNDLIIHFFQIFLFVFVLILIFDIADLKLDNPDLQTVPQQMGITNTKWLGFFVLIIFSLLIFFRNNLETVDLIAALILIFVTTAFLYFANENRSRYYTTFWVESIPIVWHVLLLVLNLYV